MMAQASAKEPTMRLLSVVLALVATAALSAQSDWDLFDKAKLSVQVDGDSRTVDVFLKFDQDSFAVYSKKTQEAIKDYPYAEIKGVEYSYAKSPRWKTALLVSPLFLFTSGKKHWFLTQGPSDFAMLQLDKSNYRMVLATMESKTGKKVELTGDDK
jgi:hypothetical protein